jgi:hypothetical protein
MIPSVLAGGEVRRPIAGTIANMIYDPADPNTCHI